MIDYRLCFTKKGDAQYISHLDLMRVFSRAVKRSKLPVWYTEGFNTHLYLNFCSPLSLGVESVCELVELRFLSDSLPKDALALINAGLPTGITVTDAYAPKDKYAEIEYAVYSFEFDKFDEQKLRAALEKPEILLTKPSKSGQKTVDVKPLIASYELCDNGLKAILACGNQRNLNPNLLRTYLEGDSGCCVAGMRREKLLKKDLSEFK